MDSFFNHSRHDEMMRIVAPSVVPQSSTSVFFKIQDLINSDNDCDLPDNEDAVDLLKYLDCSEDVCNDLPSSIPTPAQIHYEEPTIPLSQLTTVLHSSEMNNDWMPNVKRETEDPAFNGWILKSETEEDEFTKGLDLGLYSPSKFDIATGNDSDVDTESDKTATDGSISTDMFDATVPSTSTASTSRSTQAKNKVVHTARVISMPRPVGRPRGSNKKQQSVMTGHASTSNSASLPSCSKPEAENSTISNPVVLGRGFFDHSRHDEMMPIFAQSVAPPSSTPVFFNIHDHINSDIDCDLPDNEDPVDLLKYLGCPEDVVCNDLPSSIPTPAQIHYDEPTIPLSQFTTVLHSSEMNNGWMRKLKRETEDPVINGWILNSETEKDEFTKGLDLGLYSPSKFDITVPEIGIDIATGNDSDVDTESDKTATDGSISTDMFDTTVHSTSTASTSRSTQAKNKVVHTARGISMPRPVGRPRGSKKKQKSASTSKSASLPLGSKPEAENSTVSNPVVLGRGFFDHSRHDEMMPIFAPSVVPPSSTSVFFNIHDHINSDIDCDLPDNEHPVDLLKYLCCPEDVVCNDLPSSIPTPAQIHYDEPTIPLSQFTTVLHSSEMNNGWMRNLKRETEDPVINGWILKSETEEDEFTKGLDLGLYSPSKFDITVPEIEIDIATGNDSDVDTESDKMATDASISTDMFDTTAPSTSTASTSRSTQAKNKVVHTARVISMPRPVGRPRGSKKKQQSVMTGHASTSNSASLPSCSKPEAENSTVSNPVVLGRGFFDHSIHDEMMPIFAPLVVPPSSTSVFFNIHDHINSDIDCDLRDNEHPVDLLKYLGCPEDVVCYDLPSSIPTPAQIHYDEPTIPLSQLTTVLHSSEMNNGWMRKLKRETEDPVINGWILKSETEKDEFTKGLDLGLYSPSKFDITDPEIEIDIATGNDSDVDTESDETATDASCSTDMFDTTVPSASTASTSSSTKAKSKVVYTAPVISMPRPVGRPRGRPPGSKKKQQSAMTVQATTSKSASLPSCSKPEAENSTASKSVVLGRKRKLVKDDKTQSQPTYTQVPSTSITAKFYECALNPTASPPTTETAMPTIVARRTYRRNTVAVVDKEKQNHHNELERAQPPTKTCRSIH